MSKQTKAYCDALDIISAENLDFRRLVIEIAKKNPSILVRAANACGVAYRGAWEAEVRALIPHAYIESIKLCRARTGWGLKEAKDWCDQYRTPQ